MNNSVNNKRSLKNVSLTQQEETYLMMYRCQTIRQVFAAVEREESRKSINKNKIRQKESKNSNKML